MPFTIDIASDSPRAFASLHVPSPEDHGLLWSLFAAVRARLATRKLFRRLREEHVANAHLSEHLRLDIGLLPGPHSLTSHSPRSHWEIRP